MSRRRSSVPQMRLHKPSGRAVVYIDRRPVYLGKWESPEAAKAYGEFIAKLAQGHSTAEARAATPASKLTVSQLLLRYVNEELPRFSDDEQHCRRGVIRILRPMFGETLVAEFGPLKLRLVRDAMVQGDPNAVDADGNSKPRKPWCRDFINKQVKRLRAIFKWGVSWEIVPHTVAAALTTVSPLKVGETPAVDYAPREAVPDEDIEAVRALLKPRNRDFLDLLLLTGARPGELIDMHVGDLDRSGDVWRYEPKHHKTAHKGKKRVLLFNRQAQAILLRHAKADPSARFFQTSTSSFAQVVKAKCIKAGIKPWVPYQLRHTTCTMIVDEQGLEAAQHVLGHSQKAMTLHYSRAAEKKATEAIRRLGGD